MRSWVSWLLVQPAIEWFVPDGLAEEEGVERYRARLLVAFAYGLTAVGAGFSSVYAFVGVPAASIAACVGAVLVFIGPAVMQWSGSVKLGANVSGFFLYATIFVIASMTGGVRAPGLMWLTIVPTFGLVFGGFGAGVTWCGIAAATGVGFYWFDVWQVEWVWPPVQPGQWPVVETLAVVSLSLVILELFTLYRWLHLQLIEDLEEVQGQLEQQAFYDGLTNLPNRAMLQSRLRRALREFERGDSSFAFVFIDLDDFKAVNDSLGHTTGDRVMTEVAARLAANVRDTDLVARTGGDEFVVLLQSVEGLEEVEPLIERICRAFEAPLQIGSEEIHLSASIGLARADACCQRGEDRDRNIEVIRRTADRAMYRAKERTGTTVEYVEQDDRIESSRRIQRENRIRKGIDRGEFEPYYQSIYNLDDGSLIGAEVLARWHHPDHGIVYPKDFLPLIERRALIFSFGELMITEVLSDVEVLAPLLADREEFCLHVNVSPQQVADLSHLEEMADRLTACDTSIQWRLEITESQWVREDFDLGALEREGLGLVIDDFGKGYSSLGRLADMPCDGIKLDRQFVQGIDSVADHRALVRIVARLGELLEVPVVAEGIETEAELEVIRDAGVRIGQGFYFGPAKPLEDLKQELEG